jgi:hypothetical protein
MDGQGRAPRMALALALASVGQELRSDSFEHTVIWLVLEGSFPQLPLPLDGQSWNGTG